MSYRYSSTKTSQQGFTIIEIMIATTVLSVILVLCTSMMIGIGRLYSKGINQNRVQDTVRAISDEISQHLQLEGVDPIHETSDSGNIEAYCIGGTRYSFVKGKLLGPTDSKHSAHVLWRDDTPASGCLPDITFLNNDHPADSKNGVELISANSTLTELQISPNTSPYKITVGVAYGDNSAGDLYSGAGVDTTCNGGAGDQFCATAHSEVTVVQRLKK